MTDTAPVLTIHRGARQVGGCCTEIPLGGERLLLDFEANLPGAAGDVTDEELIERVSSGARSDRQALLLSHPHGDYYGLCGRLPVDVPIY